MLYPRITLKAARVNAGLSQSDAAIKIGISKSTLCNYEKGVTIPDWNVARKICDVYQFPSDYIFFGPNSA